MALITDTDWAAIDPVKVPCDRENGAFGAKIDPPNDAEETLTEVASTKFQRV